MVLLFIPFTPLVSAKFAKKYKIPFIFEIRDLWPQTFIDMGIWEKNSLLSRFFKFIETLSVKKSDKIIVLSPLTIKYLKKEYNYDEKKILLLPNGINEIFVKEVKQIEKEAVNITYAGGIDKVHGLEFLIKLAEKLKSENIIFNIYGDGKERDNLERLCKSLNLNNIIWHGSVKKTQVPEKLYEANLLFVSTSNVNYGSENKLYEYMACGKPIISAVSSLHNDPVGEIECGLSVDRNDLEKSSKLIKDFIKEGKDKFEILGKNGQNYVLENRLIKILADKLENFIKEKNV